MQFLGKMVHLRHFFQNIGLFLHLIAEIENIFL